MRRWIKALVQSADRLATLLGLRVVHLAISVSRVHELGAGRLPAQLERASHCSDTNLSISTTLGVAVFAATRFLLENGIHKPDRALLPSTGAYARAQAHAGTSVRRTPASAAFDRPAGAALAAMRTAGERAAREAAERAKAATETGGWCRARIAFTACAQDRIERVRPRRYQAWHPGTPHLFRRRRRDVIEVHLATERRLHYRRV